MVAGWVAVARQLCQLVETAPSGPQWLHEIKLDGFRMSARIERGRVQLLTRTGLDWSDKYPSVVEALAKVGAKPAYLDGELCGIGDDGLPSFSQTQAVSDGSWDSARLFRFRPALVLKSTASQDLGRKAIVKGLLRYEGEKVGPISAWSIECLPLLEEH